ncbi:MAG: TIGR02147 family protein [Bacteriovoracaceae bacterium]
MQYSSYHDLLNEEFERRKMVNSSYSLRAYARDLNLPAPRLSQILSKKQGISIEIAEDISKKLKFDESKKQWFCSSVGALHSRSFKERIKFKEKVQHYKSEAKHFSEIHLEYFRVIAEWYHFAILELTYLQDFQNDPIWIANILGITSVEATEAIVRMKSLDLVREEDGRLVDVFKFLATPSDVPSISIKKFQTQMMKKAIEALHEQDVPTREMSSNIMAISTERIPEFKEKLRDFRREFEQEASQDKNKTAVYCLGIQFFELTKDNQ